MTLHRTVTIALVALAAACSKTESPPAAVETAELVFKNANIYTVDSAKTKAT